MRQKLSRTLRTQFEKSMLARLPEFTPEKAPWGKQYAYNGIPGLKCLVSLYTARDTDSFVVEVGWSPTSNFLAAKLIRTLESLDRSAPDSRIALDILWGERDPMYVFGVGRQPRMAHDLYDRTEDELLPEAREKAKLAVQRTIDYALPIFREVARVRGCEVQFEVRSERERRRNGFS